MASKYNEIAIKYAYGYINDDQLAEYVTLKVITQEQADAIKLNKIDPGLSYELDKIAEKNNVTDMSIAEITTILSTYQTQNESAIAELSLIMSTMMTPTA